MMVSVAEAAQKFSRPFEGPFLICETPEFILKLMEAWDTDNAVQFNELLQISQMVGACAIIPQTVVLETEGMEAQTQTAKKLNPENENQWFVLRLYKVFHEGQVLYLMDTEVNNKS